ncbi:hypothetical protein FACS1894208_08630 [Clostridia bacterium]|nr:hypothetical protein FACS1894208_08630 [Clostridia bacterium]
MLVEIRYDKFISHGKARPPIRFGEKEYRFSRNTVEASTIHVCNEKYQASGAEYMLDQYKNWLNTQYGTSPPQLSFRDAVGRYIRVYGRDNLSEKRPLLYAHGGKDEAAITALMKLFNTFSVIADLREEEKCCAAEKSATLKAQKFNLVPSTNKTQVKKNVKEIDELKKLL